MNLATGGFFQPRCNFCPPLFFSSSKYSPTKHCENSSSESDQQKHTHETKLA